MEVKNLEIPGVKLISPKIHQDYRGFFVETYNQNRYQQEGVEQRFVQDNLAFSKEQGTLRGLHFQVPPSEHVKLVSCVNGEIFDVVLDLRVGSPTFGEHQAFVLDGKSGDCLYVPKGLAHGFMVQSESAVTVYQTSTEYAPQHDTGVLWGIFS